MPTTGQQSPLANTLRVEPSSIPELRRAFESALNRLDPQVDMAITDLRIRPWAGDPVSAEAATRFNDASVDSGEGALHALQSYQRQLKAAADALRDAEAQYRATEGDNAALWGKKHR
ncbi:transcriptional regulator [Streptoalloteichus hindustanus]|uniref:transcriptional regulator n=1 Tax=Streptoalloteichus hindustanus TaxID=2017 RepID=UPI0011612E54|nr:transcriptional regulator [Streptoalloteichus hindustanus]